MSASELEDQVLDADASGNKLKVDALLLGAIKNLKSNKAKPDTIMVMNLMYLAKSRPEFFLSNRVVEVSFTFQVFLLIKDLRPMIWSSNLVITCVSFFIK